MHPAYHTGTHLPQSSAPPLTGDSTCTSSFMPHVMYTLTPFPMSPSVPNHPLTILSISHESSILYLTWILFCAVSTAHIAFPLSDGNPSNSIANIDTLQIPYKDYQQVHIMSLFSDPQSSQSAMPTPPSSCESTLPPSPSLLLDSRPQTPTPPSSRDSTPCLMDSQPSTPTPPSSRRSKPCLMDSQPPTPTPPSSQQSKPCLMDSQPLTLTPPSSRESTPCLMDSQPPTPTPPSSRQSKP